jgi:hypothetical protein
MLLRCAVIQRRNWPTAQRRTSSTILASSGWTIIRSRSHVVPPSRPSRRPHGVDQQGCLCLYAYTEQHDRPKEDVGNKGGSLSNRLCAVLNAYPLTCLRRVPGRPGPVETLIGPLFGRTHPIVL